MSAKHGLEYILSLKDNMTDKVKGIVGEVDKIGTRGKEAVATLGAGLAGLVGVGASLHAAIAPALELDRAIGELAKFDVAEEAIEKTKNQALQLSAAIGESAQDIANNAFDVKKAITGINDVDLGAANNAIYLLGSATRSNAKTATAYMSVLHGIFSKEAAKMGEADWVSAMAGKTEKATTLFKTSLEDIKGGFNSLSNTAKKFGISFDEQLAVIGNLKGIAGSGSAAAGKYKKVLNGLGKAQGELGIKFSDSKGRMDNIVTVLTKIKAKYGEAIPTGKLEKAFGKDGAGAVIHLLKNVDQLKGSIKELEATTNGDYLKDKVAAASDAFQQLGSQFENFKLIIGGEMAAILYPILDKFSKMGQTVIDWVTNNKEAAQSLAKLTLGFFALTAAAPLLMTITGAFKLWGAGLSTLALPLQLLGIKLPLVGKGAKEAGEGVEIITQKTSRLRQLSGFLKSAIVAPFKLGNKATQHLTNAVKFLMNPMKLLQGFGFLIGKTFVVAFSMIKGAFLLAFSPFTLIVAGLTILIALAWKFREQIMAFASGAIKGFTEFGLTFEPIKAALARVWEIFSGLGTKLFEILGISNDTTASLADWSATGEMVGKLLGEALQFVINLVGDLIVGIAEIAGMFGRVVLNIISLWKNVTDAFTNGSWLDVFKALISGIGKIFSDILEDVKILAIKAINWLIEKFNQFTGTKFTPIEIPVKMDIPPIPKQIQSVGGNIATFATTVGNVAQSQTKVSDIPQSAKPQSFSPVAGKTLTSVANNNQRTVTNNITVNATTNASANDIARTIAERQQMGG